jgi:outer membrane lipoprotein SlyB
LAFASPSLSITKKASSFTEIRATSSSQERKLWDVFRFARQSSRFISLFPGNTKGVQVVRPGDILWKPGQPQNSFTFAPLDDVVMGGASSSGFDANTGKWTGQVTDANNGGFVGIRSTPNLNLDMTKCKGLELKLRSKKQKRIKVAVRDNTEFNGITWATSVDLKNGSVVRVPFAKQVPTVFAKTVTDNKAFRKDQVTAVQLVYSKFEYDGKLNPRFELGNVDVQIEEIKAY